MAFNYGKFHFFDKSGTELMLKRQNNVTLTILNNDFPEFQCKYSFISSTPDLSDALILKISDGSKYTQSDSINVKVEFADGTSNIVNVPNTYFTWHTYASSNAYIEYGNEDSSTSIVLEGYPELNFNTLNADHKQNFIELLELSNIDTPTMTFEGNLLFDKVSTELVETQSIYVLVESEGVPYDVFGTNAMVDLETYSGFSSDASTYIENYDLFFFIDCRNQTDFRFFSIDGDDVVWSDRHTMHFNNGRCFGSDNGYRVDIGFKGEMEGVYEDKMYICLLEKSTQTVTIIGSFNMSAETEGEDERYRAFISNFGLPEMDEIEPVFKDSDINDAYPDHVSRNKHAKKMFLTYSEIFPYAGSYKALANAVKFLGYDDIFFKEWYKEINTPTSNDDGYVAFNMSFKSSDRTNTISEKSIEERIHMKKMNWISMMYKLNEEVDKTVDKWGFPTTENTVNYYNAGNILKLISLKEWLEKYIIGINNRITDVGGEGIVFERFNLAKIGQYQRVFDYTSEKNLSVTLNDKSSVIIDGSCNIPVVVSTTDAFSTFENFKGTKFTDMCEGYFDENCEFVDQIDNIEDSSLYVYFGKTFELENNTDTFEIRAKCVSDTFKFNNTDFIDINHPQLLVDNDKIIFDPLDILNKPKNAMFKNLPVLKIYNGTIWKYVKSNEGELEYRAQIKINDNGGVDITQWDINSDDYVQYHVNDVLTLVPPRHTEDSSYIYIKPRFSETGTIEKHGPFEIMDYGSMLVYNRIDRLSYGIRYCNDTFTGEPVFKIVGYQSPEIFSENSTIFPYSNIEENDEAVEYFVEILNGCMIFNDPNNNRKVSLNFDYDGYDMKITVDNLQHSDGFVAYSYKISSTDFINRFTPGCDYRYFLSEYINNPENCVFSNNIHNLKVYNTGTYTIDAVIFDQYNNMFCDRSNSVFTVNTPDISFDTISNDPSTGNNYSYNPKNVDENLADKLIELGEQAEDKCIYEFVPKENIVEKTKDSSSYKNAFTLLWAYPDKGIDGSVVYTRSSSFRNGDYKKYAQISNTTDRFIYAGSYSCSFSQLTRITKTVYSFLRMSINSENWGSVGVNCYDDIIDVTTRENLRNPEDGYSVDAILEDVYNLSTNSYIGSLADIIITVYDECSEYPIYSYPGMALPMKKYGHEDHFFADEYRVVLDDSVMEPGEEDEFKAAISKPSCTIFISPAWALECQIPNGNGSNAIVTEHNGIGYPFKKHMYNDDTYRISFINKNDFLLYGDDVYELEYGYQNADVTEDNKILLTYSYTDNYDFPRYQDDPDNLYYEPWENNSEIEDVSMRDTYIRTRSKLGTGSVDNPFFSNGFGHASYHVKDNLDSSFKIDSNINKRCTNDVTTFLGRAPEYYLDFVLPVDTRNSDFKNGLIKLQGNPSIDDLFYYIDTNYTISLRDFDIRNGIKLWGDIDSYNLSDMYSFSCPISTSNSQIIVAPKISKLFTDIDSNDITVKWSIYLQVKNSERKLLFECFNKILFLNLKDEGTYDIKLTVYDKHGNKHVKDMIGAITKK